MSVLMKIKDTAYSELSIYFSICLEDEPEMLTEAESSSAAPSLTDGDDTPPALN